MRQGYVFTGVCDSVYAGRGGVVIHDVTFLVKLYNTKCFIAGNALLRRLVRIGVLDEAKMKLDYVLGLKLEDFLERRLQTQVFKLGLAKSIHHARVLIRQRHIR